MFTIRKIAAFCLLPAAGLFAAAATNAQTPQNVAPAKRLADIPPTPAEASGQVPRLTVRTPRGGAVHVMPTPAVAAARKAAAKSVGLQPLLYNGGPVMAPDLQIYEIFWAPATLQNGTKTGPFSAKYGLVLESLGEDWPGHGLMNLTTQYFQTVGGVTTYIQNGGRLAGAFVDTDPLPASGCTDSFTPGNCVTDAQVQTEIQNVMTAHSLTGGLNKIFVLFTPNGEGSCIDSSSTQCAYSLYCAYHGNFGPTATPVIYANLPYANASVCQATGQTEPNGDVGDLVANSASHEIAESVTDPLLNAWFDASGNEIGDICNFIFGTNTWPGPSAMGNESFNGFVFELQQLYDNNAGACERVGPP